MSSKAPVWTPKGSNPWMVGLRISPLCSNHGWLCKSWTARCSQSWTLSHLLSTKHSYLFHASHLIQRKRDKNTKILTLWQQKKTPSNNLICLAGSPLKNSKHWFSDLSALLKGQFCSKTFLMVNHIIVHSVNYVGFYS